jgi:transcriptional regulator GlxA family with amidase domain
MPEPETTDFRIAEAVRLIESNFDRDLDFNALAETLNLSASRFRHLFKAETGMSFRKYLRQQRMKQAKHLLETSFLSVKETAKRAGIGNISHFVRDFEKEFGLSPARYRKQYHRAVKEQLSLPESEQKSEIVKTANK